MYQLKMCNYIEGNGFILLPLIVVSNLTFNCLGTGPKVAFGNGVGQLQKAANGKVGSDVNFAVSAVNYEYVDSGLIGAFIVSDAASAGKVELIVDRISIMKNGVILPE